MATSVPGRQHIVITAMPSSDGVERLNNCGVLDEPLLFTVPGTVEQLSEGGRG